MSIGLDLLFVLPVNSVVYLLLMLYVFIDFFMDLVGMCLLRCYCCKLLLRGFNVWWVCCECAVALLAVLW